MKENRKKNSEISNIAEIVIGIINKSKYRVLINSYLILSFED
jgi:hypothetical protein